jgi:hypothetical protein
MRHTSERNYNPMEITTGTTNNCAKCQTSTSRETRINRIFDLMIAPGFGLASVNKAWLARVRRVTKHETKDQTAMMQDYPNKTGLRNG